MNFFLQKKNIILITAIISIILGGLTLVPAMSHAFGPWVLKDAITDSTKLVAFIFIIIILMALTEIILGAALCTKKWREKLAIKIPLFILIAVKLVLLIISTIIFGFVSGNIPFYVLGFILIVASLTGFIYSFCLMNEKFSTKIVEKRAAKVKPAKEKKEEPKELKEPKEKKEEKESPIQF